MFRSPMRSSSASFFISLLRLLSLKFTKNVKDPLCLCGSIRLVCLHCVLRTQCKISLHGACSEFEPDIPVTICIPNRFSRNVTFLYTHLVTIPVPLLLHSSLPAGYCDRTPSPGVLRGSTQQQCIPLCLLVPYTRSLCRQNAKT